MRCTILFSSISLLILGGFVAAATAQERTNQRSTTSESSSEDRDDTSSSATRNRTGQTPDPEARIRYDDEGNRLHIDVDEEIRFREGRLPDDAWAKEGEFDLRYDRDRNTLTGQGEGTLRLDEIGSDTARWWQSWWEGERQARRTRQEGAEWGAYIFIRRHDQNQDGYLSRTELPRSDRSEFSRIDANDNGYLSRSEIRRFGDSLYDNRMQTSTRTANRDDQTWSEWWASWWSDDQISRDRDLGAESGARQFVRQHDDNDDGYVSQREIPARMRDDFARVDRNDDNYLSLSELRQAGALLHGRDSYQDRGVARNTSRATDDRYRTQNDYDQTWSEWWASWWSDDTSGDRTSGAASGSRQFVRLHDDNEDGYVSYREIPERMRDEFSNVDTNDDDYLSSSEIQRSGSLLYGRGSDRNLATNRNAGYRTAGNDADRQDSRNQADQAWSEWWASWWSDNEEGSSADVATRGASEFIRRHDRNDDGYLVRSELPSRMYDEFSRIDRNDDRYLSSTEIRRHAEENRQFRPGSGTTASGPASSSGRSVQTTRAAESLQSGQSPVQVAYVWIVDRNQDQTNVRDLQQAYTLLRKLDENQDGQISQSELSQRREQAVVQWCQECFEALDQDNSNTLSREEAKRSIFEAQFEQFDDNRNDSLTMSEIRQSIEDELRSQRSVSRDAEDASDRR